MTPLVYHFQCFDPKFLTSFLFSKHLPVEQNAVICEFGHVVICWKKIVIVIKLVKMSKL